MAISISVGGVCFFITPTGRMSTRVIPHTSEKPSKVSTESGMLFTLVACLVLFPMTFRRSVQCDYNNHVLGRYARVWTLTHDVASDKRPEH